jgi:hypothetical protein
VTTPTPSAVRTSAAVTFAAVIAAAASRTEAAASSETGGRVTSAPSRVMPSSGSPCAVWPVRTRRLRRLAAR